MYSVEDKLHFSEGGFSGMAGWRDDPFFSNGIQDKATSYERDSGPPITVGSGNYYFSTAVFEIFFQKRWRDFLMN